VGVSLENPALRDQLTQADHLDSGEATPGSIRDQISATLESAVDQHGLLHPVPMQVMIHVVNRWVGYKESVGESVLDDVLTRIKRACREVTRNSRFNDNIFNVLLRLSESCARAGKAEEGLQFMSLNEFLIESWRGRNHPDYAGAIYNLGRYFRLLGRNEDALSEFNRALLVTGSEDFSEIQKHTNRALERLTEGMVHQEYADPDILRSWFCLLESTLLPQRKTAAKEILQICRKNSHLELRAAHEGIGKGRADTDPDVWQPLSLARLHLGSSPAHVEASLVLERELSSAQESIREEAISLLSRMPAGRPEVDLFEVLSLHMSHALRSEDPFVVEHAARCLHECAGWQDLSSSVVKTVSDILSAAEGQLAHWMMGILYSSAQYSETDLTPAVAALEKAHRDLSELRPKPGRTLCRHYERVLNETYIDGPESTLKLPLHWKGEQSRIPLYGLSDKVVENRVEGVGSCVRCGSLDVSCLFSSTTVCEVYCVSCDRYSNYRFLQDPLY